MHIGSEKYLQRWIGAGGELLIIMEKGRWEVTMAQCIQKHGLESERG